VFTLCDVCRIKCTVTQWRDIRFKKQCNVFL
jgi:hypothetical protein